MGTMVGAHQVTPSPFHMEYELGVDHTHLLSCAPPLNLRMECTQLGYHQGWPVTAGLAGNEPESL
jgi:hypothetical protein